MAVPGLLGGEKPDAEKWADILSFLGVGVVKSIDQIVSASTTLVDDTELRLPYLAGCVYEVHMGIIQSSNSTADMKFQLAETGGGGTAGKYIVDTIPSGGSAFTLQLGALGTVFSSEGASADRAIRVDGQLVTGTNPGTLKMMWAQNTSNSATAVAAGSWMTIRRVA